MIFAVEPGRDLPRIVFGSFLPDTVGGVQKAKTIARELMGEELIVDRRNDGMIRTGV